VYAVAFFKVVQQQTVGEVGNSIMCLWIDNFWLQKWKNYKNRTVFAKVMLKWKRVQFFDSQCRIPRTDNSISDTRKLKTARGHLMPLQQHL